MFRWLRSCFRKCALDRRHPFIVGELYAYDLWEPNDGIHRGVFVKETKVYLLANADHEQTHRTIFPLILPRERILAKDDELMPSAYLANALANWQTGRYTLSDISKLKDMFPHIQRQGYQ